MGPVAEKLKNYTDDQLKNYFKNIVLRDPNIYTTPSRIQNAISQIKNSGAYILNKPETLRRIYELNIGLAVAQNFINTKQKPKSDQINKDSNIKYQEFKKEFNSFMHEAWQNLSHYGMSILDIDLRFFFEGTTLKILSIFRKTFKQTKNMSISMRAAFDVMKDHENYITLFKEAKKIINKTYLILDNIDIFKTIVNKFKDFIQVLKKIFNFIQNYSKLKNNPTQMAKYFEPIMGQINALKTFLTSIAQKTPWIGKMLKFLGYFQLLAGMAMVALAIYKNAGPAEILRDLAFALANPVVATQGDGAGAIIATIALLYQVGDDIYTLVKDNYDKLFVDFQVSSNPMESYNNYSNALHNLKNQNQINEMDGKTENMNGTSVNFNSNKVDESKINSLGRAKMELGDLPSEVKKLLDFINEIPVYEPYKDDLSKLVFHTNEIDELSGLDKIRLFNTFPWLNEGASNFNYAALTRYIATQNDKSKTKNIYLKTESYIKNNSSEYENLINNFHDIWSIFQNQGYNLQKTFNYIQTKYNKLSDKYKLMDESMGSLRKLLKKINNTRILFPILLHLCGEPIQDSSMKAFINNNRLYELYSIYTTTE